MVSIGMMIIVSFCFVVDRIVREILELKPCIAIMHAILFLGNEK
jgi:hypothetical protein